LHYYDGTSIVVGYKDLKIEFMGLAKSIVTRGMGIGTGIGTAGAGLGAAGIATAASMAGEGSGQYIVPEGYVAVRTRFKHVKKDREGRPQPVILGEGFHPFVVPFAHSLKLISVRDRVSELGVVQIDRGQQLNVEAWAKWKVSRDGNNPYRALFHAEEGELGQIVISTCVNGLRNVMTGIGEEDLLNEDRIYNQVNYLCHEKLLHYGTVLLGLSIRDIAPRDAEIQRMGIREGIMGLAGKLALGDIITPELRAVNGGN
jgi:regulator of protease activity HflC (stomatin/prohibitin superfamily)